jgi:hypothetical protein
MRKQNGGTETSREFHRVTFGLFGQTRNILKRRCNKIRKLNWFWSRPSSPNKFYSEMLHLHQSNAVWGRETPPSGLKNEMRFMHPRLNVSSQENPVTAKLLLHVRISSRISP